MHDIKMIRENPESFDAALGRRGEAAAAAAILALDGERRRVATQMQEAQSRRNEASKAIGAAKARRQEEEAAALMAEVAALKQSLPALEAEEKTLTARLHEELARLPNMPDAQVPDGADESGNIELSRWGTPRSFDFTPREHADIGPALGLDFETGVAMSGARFTFLRGQMARLHRALGQFMLDRQTIDHGYVECAPPLLVRDDAVFGTGQLPKFADDLFRTGTALDASQIALIEQQAEETRKSGVSGRVSTVELMNSVSRLIETVKKQIPPPENRRWLIPTAEVSLTNSVRDRLLSDSTLSLRLTALTPCFRSEAGAAGRDTRGFIRQHQFEKVELVSICRPEDSAEEHERMTGAAEAILQALNLPYRKMLLCAGDMGFTAQKTYDLEVWLPGQSAYREISSISNCGPFQARRMNARYRPAPTPENPHPAPEFVHTLNGSGLAVGRTLVAVLENYQEADGSVIVPQALRPYMGDIERLTPSSDH